MAVIAFTSASGAPGVTTATLALTRTWPRMAVMAECDPAGGSAVLAGPLAASVKHDRGLVQLAIAQRHDQLADALWQQMVPLWTGDTPHPDQQRYLLPGLQDAAQAPNMPPAWPALAREFRNLSESGTDVLIDAGRAGTEHAPIPLLRGADLTVLLVRGTLPAINAARARLSVLRIGTADPLAQRHLALMLVGETPKFSAAKVSRALDLPVLASLPLDPITAEVYSQGTKPGRRHDSSPLMRSLRAAIPALLTAAAHPTTARTTAPAGPAAATNAPRPGTTYPMPQEQSHV